MVWVASALVASASLVSTSHDVRESHLIKKNTIITLPNYHAECNGLKSSDVFNIRVTGSTQKLNSMGSLKGDFTSSNCFVG